MRHSLLLIALVLLPTLTFAELPEKFRSKLSYQDGVSAAMEISNALSKLPQLQKEGSAVIKRQTVILCDLVKKFDAPGMMTTEALVGSIVKMIELGFSPAKICNIEEAFQSMLVKLNGFNASLYSQHPARRSFCWKPSQESNQSLIQRSCAAQRDV